MSIKLSVPEFVVALFGLNPNQCRLTITGRIANVHGLAYQVQSLLCDQLKFQSRSYRAGTVSLGGETLDNFNERPSLATARFSINTLIDELAKVQITHTGGVAALFGKDEAWSWRLPRMVFITAAIFFSTLIVWNLSKAPIYNPKEFFCFVVGVIFLSLLCCLFFPKILRYLLDIPIPGHKLETTIDMSVVRAEILYKLRALPPETQKLGIISLIFRFINDDKSQTSGHTIAELRKDLDNTLLRFSEEKERNASLLTMQKELQSQIDELKTKDETLEGERKALASELAVKKESCEMSEIRCQRLAHELEIEQEVHVSDVKKLKDDISKLTIEYTDNDYVKVCVVLKGSLIFLDKYVGIPQEELANYFQTVDEHQKDNGKNGTRMQACTVRNTFAKASKVFNTKYKEEDFSHPDIFKKMSKFYCRHRK